MPPPTTTRSAMAVACHTSVKRTRTTGWLMGTERSVDDAVATYGAAWNETDEDKRRELLTEAFAETGTYLDPTGAADSREALVAHIGGFHQMFPGHTIDMASAVDVHGKVFRFA